MNMLMDMPLIFSWICHPYVDGYATHMLMDVPLICWWICHSYVDGYATHMLMDMPLICWWMCHYIYIYRAQITFYATLTELDCTFLSLRLSYQGNVYKNSIWSKLITTRFYKHAHTSGLVTSTIATCSQQIQFRSGGEDVVNSYVVQVDKPFLFPRPNFKSSHKRSLLLHPLIFLGPVSGGGCRRLLCRPSGCHKTPNQHL